MKPILPFVAGAMLAASGAPSAAERSLDKEVVVSATLDQTWDAWTTREGIVSFFAPDAKVEPKVGGAFQIYIDPGAPRRRRRRRRRSSGRVAPRPQCGVTLAVTCTTSAPPCPEP